MPLEKGQQEAEQVCGSSRLPGDTGGSGRWQRGREGSGQAGAFVSRSLAAAGLAPAGSTELAPGGFKGACCLL